MEKGLKHARLSVGNAKQPSRSAKSRYPHMDTNRGAVKDPHVTNALALMLHHPTLRFTDRPRLFRFGCQWRECALHDGRPTVAGHPAVTDIQAFAGPMEGLVKPAKRHFDPIAFLARVGTGKTVQKYRKNRLIYAQGDEADRIFYIQSGNVKVTVVSEQGKEAVVGLLEAGHFFGEGCLHGQTVRVGTARAMQECLITSITRKAMLAALRREPRFAELFTTYLVTRSNRIEEDLIDQLFNSSEKRLARLLLLLANFGKVGAPTSIDASINQGTLAEMIGKTRPRRELLPEQVSQAGID